VQGQIGPSVGEPTAGLIWLVAVAYDADGQIVGFRRWEWRGSISAGAFQPFAIIVYSQGPAIDHVEMLVEARP
jgi:hypothetical protein